MILHFPHSMRGWCCVVATCLLLAPRATTAAADATTPEPVTGGQVPYRIWEKGYDKEVTITPQTRKVDANSDIIIMFQPRTNVPPAEPSPEWLRLNNVLESVQRAFAARTALRDRLKNINLADTNAIERLKADNKAFSRAA